VRTEQVLFRGSVRKNLDPCAVSSEASIWAILRRAGLTETATPIVSDLDQDVPRRLGKECRSARYLCDHSAARAAICTWRCFMQATVKMKMQMQPNRN